MKNFDGHGWYGESFMGSVNNMEDNMYFYYKEISIDFKYGWRNNKHEIFRNNGVKIW